MALDTAFTCPNGHNFSANAKLRARCPECGSLARRSFQQNAVPKPDPEEPEKAITQPSHTSVKKPVLLRQGKRMPVKKAPVVKTVVKTKAPVKTVAKKVTTPKAKVSGGLVTTKRVPRGVTPTIKKLPRRTAPARHVVGEGRKSGLGGYVSEMMKRAGFGG